MTTLAQKISGWCALLVRLGLGATFLFSGAIKARASEEFALALIPFTILPASWIGVFALALAWTEILAGVLVVLPRVHRIGAAVIFSLALLFIAVLTWALSNDIIVSCGCFGNDEPPSARAMQLAILRDVGIACAAAFVLFLPGRRRLNT